MHTCSKFNSLNCNNVRRTFGHDHLRDTASYFLSLSNLVIGLDETSLSQFYCLFHICAEYIPDLLRQ